jgi:hypothetical protein
VLLASVAAESCPRCADGPVWVGYALGLVLVVLLFNAGRLVAWGNRAMRDSIAGRSPEQEAHDEYRNRLIGRVLALAVFILMFASLLSRVRGT